jgi:hypothetical protein
MGEVLLGTYKSYVNSVYTPRIQPIASNTALDAAGDLDEDQTRESMTETSADDSISIAEDAERHALPAEDDEDIPSPARQENIRHPLTKRGWLFSSAYRPTARDLEIRRQYLPMPRRVISPWCTNWEGRELNEMVLFKSFGNPGMSRNDQHQTLSVLLICCSVKRCSGGTNGAS